MFTANTSAAAAASTISTTTNDKSDKEEISLEQEISQLQNLVLSLREREMDLELQLAGYKNIRELEGKLKVRNVIAKSYAMKIESLKTENKNLQVNEEEAKEKIKSLKSKIKELEEENGIIGNLHGRVSVSHEEKSKKLMELENQMKDLQIMNSELKGENLELLKKLEKAQLGASQVK